MNRTTRQLLCHGLASVWLAAMNTGGPAPGSKPAGATTGLGGTDRTFVYAKAVGQDRTVLAAGEQEAYDVMAGETIHVATDATGDSVKYAVRDEDDRLVATVRFTFD